VKRNPFLPDELEKKEKFEIPLAPDLPQVNREPAAIPISEPEVAPPRSIKDKFLEIIAFLESSGGRNFKHRQMQSGIHKGTSAAGTYGLMPNTAIEIANRARMAGELTPEMTEIYSMEPNEIKAYIESNPELERQFANLLARRTIDRSDGDLEKAAYRWFMGHNLPEKRLQERNYLDTEYVRRFQRERDQRFPDLMERLQRKQNEK
jgi:hypothetical protein